MLSFVNMLKVTPPESIERARTTKPYNSNTLHLVLSQALHSYVAHEKKLCALECVF